ncbi:hypothetical protein BH09ACT11_BH09ACT11_04060 [soil metagenome]
MAGLILYDDDCGFCTRVAHLASRLGIRAQIQALSTADLISLGVSPERSIRELPYVDGSGQVHYGHHAFAAALATGSRVHRWVGRALERWPIDPIAARAYTWLAANRQHLPGGTSACALPED